jgi:hypothetical protein
MNAAGSTSKYFDKVAICSRVRSRLPFSKRERTVLLIPVPRTIAAADGHPVAAPEQELHVLVNVYPVRSVYSASVNKSAQLAAFKSFTLKSSSRSRSSIDLILARVALSRRPNRIWP